MSPDLHDGTLPYEDMTSENVHLDRTLFLILAGMFTTSVFVGYNKPNDLRDPPSLINIEYQFIHTDGIVIPTFIAIGKEMVATTLGQKLHGLSIFILQRIGKFAFLSLFPYKGTNLRICFLLNVLVDMLLSTLKVANVHFIISQHSRPQVERPTILRCVFSLSVWWRTFPAALVHSVCSSVCFYLPIHASRVLFLEREEDDTHVGWKEGAVVMLIATLYFAAVVPSYAVFLRIAASTLPAQKTPKKKAEGIGSMTEAWRSFPPSAQSRFFGSLANVLVMEVVMAFVLSAFVLLLFHPLLHEDVILFFVKYAG